VAEDWVRFNFHASRVRNLCIYGRADIGHLELERSVIPDIVANVFDAVSSSWTLLQHLPNLRRLEIHETHHHDIEHASILIGPKLEELLLEFSNSQTDPSDEAAA
jgi:hypothetical protein